MRVAVAQIAARAGEVVGNIEAARRALTLAADQGAALAVFPELFVCGYDIAGIAADPSRYGVAAEQSELADLAETCRAHGVAAVMGACLREADGLSNAALVFDARGRNVGIYRKVHLWAEERRVFRAGNRLAVVDLNGWRIGLAICYDAGFPEHCRALALAGAQLIVCPSAFAVGEEERRYRLYFPMRALENTVFVVAANALGEQGGAAFFGDSLICAPDGRLLLKAEGEGVAAVDLSMEQLAEARARLPYLAERRANDLPIEEYR